MSRMAGHGQAVVAVATAALLLICLHLVEAQPGPGGNPSVIYYWNNQSLPGLALILPGLVSPLSGQEVSLFRTAITSRALLAPSSTDSSKVAGSSASAAQFCSAAGLVCGEQAPDGTGVRPGQQQKPKELVLTEPWDWSWGPWSWLSGKKQDEETSSTKPPEQPAGDAAELGSEHPDRDIYLWGVNPVWRSMQPDSNSDPRQPGSSKPDSNSDPKQPGSSKPDSNSDPKQPGSTKPTEAQLARARYTYLLQKNLPTAGTHAPAGPFRNVPSFSGAFLPRELSQALGLLDWTEFLQAVQVPESSAWASTLAGTWQICSTYGAADDVEVRACAQSLEEVADFVVSRLGHYGNNVSMAVSDTLSGADKVATLDVSGVEKLSSDGKSTVICHDIGSFPHKVLACHDIRGTELHKVTVKLGSVVATNVVACHTDTTTFHPNHIAFQVLGVKPGETGVCHYTIPGTTGFY